MRQLHLLCTREPTADIDDKKNEKKSHHCNPSQDLRIGSQLGSSSGWRLTSQELLVPLQLHGGALRGIFHVLSLAAMTH